jgi:hypothetical protein
MRLFRNLLPVLTVGIATLAIAGVSAALEADPAPPVAVPTEQAPAGEELACPGDTTPEPVGTTDGTEGDTSVAADDAAEGDGTEADDGTTDATEGDDCDDAGVAVDDEDEDLTDVEVDDEVGVDEPEVTTTHPDNHGAAVSEAAHTCPTGPEHGACVSAVAQSDAGKDHGGTDESDETHDRPERNAKGNGEGNGKGGRRG